MKWKNQQAGKISLLKSKTLILQISHLILLIALWRNCGTERLVTCLQWESRKVGALWPVASLTMLSCFQTISLVPVLGWSPLAPKDRKGFVTNADPTAVLSEPTQCWAHSVLHFSKLSWLFVRHILDAACGLHHYLYCFVTWALPNTCYPRLIWTSKMPRGQQEVSCSGFCLDRQTFPSYHSGSGPNMPCRQGKVQTHGYTQ